MVDKNANSVYRVSTSGTIEVTASVSGGADWICAGPDGRLWVTLDNSGIVPIATDGTVGTEITLTGAGQLTHICTGPDNNLWVTDRASSDTAAKVWRVGVDGSTASVVLDSGTGTEPQSICTGAGGDLWVGSDFGPHFLYKVTTDLVVTGFGPDSIAGIGICSGPDGSLWVVDYNGGVTIWPFDVLVPGLEIVQGRLAVPNIPTADPHVVNQVWSNSGVLTVSAG